MSRVRLYARIVEWELDRTVDVFESDDCWAVFGVGADNRDTSDTWWADGELAHSTYREDGHCGGGGWKREFLLWFTDKCDFLQPECPLK